MLQRTRECGGGGVYPGWWGEGVAGVVSGRVSGRAIPVPQIPVPGPIFSVILASGPTHGQMKGNSLVFMRFLRICSRIDPELTRNDPELTQNRPSQTIPRLVPRCPLRSHIQTSDILCLRIGLFDSLLTVAERIYLRSKDWIRAPSQSQEYTYGR